MLNRRTLLGSLGLAAVGAGAVGCAGNRADAGGAAPSTSPGAAEEGAFPVTLEHRFGSTTIEGAPSRIVCVGMKEQDDLLALGIVPVGATEWITFAGGGLLGAWADDLADEDKITKLSQDDGIEYEKIAGLRPDLILGLYSGMTSDAYDKLSRLAPVVAPPPEVADWGIDWDDQALAVGRAVGRPQQMQQVVDEVRAKITSTAEAHPEFAGQTALVATLYEGIYLYGPQDPRSRIITQLGFELPAGLGELTGDESFGASISEEKISYVDTDVLLWLVGPSEQGLQTLEQNKIYQNLRVTQEGRAMTIGGNTTLDNAFNFVTVLSIPYLLQQLPSRLSVAVDGDPDTKPEDA